MVRMLVRSLLTLALAVSLASADDTVTANQLETLVTAAAGLASGGTTSVTLTINGTQVAFTVTKDALGNITATGPANASIQTIAISTGTSGTATNVPLAATVISSGGAITSYNLSTSPNGTITATTSTSAVGTPVTQVVNTGSGTETVTTSVTTSSNGTTTDTITTAIGGGGSTTGIVTIVFAPGTSPVTSSVVSPH